MLSVYNTSTGGTSTRLDLTVALPPLHEVSGETASRRDLELKLLKHHVALFHIVLIHLPNLYFLGHMRKH